MLRPRFSSQGNPAARPGCTVVRFLLVILATMGAWAGSTHAQVPSIEGAWSQVWDWQCDTVSLENCPPEEGCEVQNGPRIKLLHGALIPHGPYQGSVLMWGQYANATETFLWMPSNPIRLFRVSGPAGHPVFRRDVNGISMAWDDEGQLVVVGAASIPGTPSGETWRFFPAALNFPPMQTILTPAPPCNQWYAKVQGSPWRSNATMSVARHQSTLIALCRGTIFGGIASGSTFVLGGTTAPAANDGWEFWQALAPRSAPGGSAWSQTLVPNVTAPHAHPTPNEVYAAQGGLTEVQHETTPCVLQLATAGQAIDRHVKTPFVAQDSNLVYNPAGGPTSNTPGRSWVVRPRYEALPATWEIWGGASASSDRSQGTAVLRHDLVQLDGTGRNRVIAIGGVTYAAGFPAGWHVNQVIAEYQIAPGAQPTQATWLNLPIPSTGAVPIGRMDNSAVILPTGDILVIGGGTFPGRVPDPSQVALTPEYQPQLVRPGPAGTQSPTWSVTPMAPSPAPPAHSIQAPRLRGHAAVLLADGRVLTAGGAFPATPSISFTGEVFSPPYKFFGFQPTIVSVSSTELEFGASFAVDVARGQDEVVDRVVLLRPASVAYGFDTSQRYVELQFNSNGYTQGVDSLTVQAPPDDLGPPGHYMLFVVTRWFASPALRVPSQAQFVRLRLQ